MKAQRAEPAPEQLRRLWDHATSFIDKQEVTCSEAVYQSDDVITNAYEFVDGVGEIVGWHERDDDE